MLLDAHVAHFHFLDELIDRQAAASFEGVQDFEPLGAAYFC
jgi:hypothetical protein